MGSGRNNRKKGDSPIIRRPKSAIAFVGINIGNPGVPEAVAEVCPISFDVRLNKSLLTEESVKVYLYVKGDIHVIKIGNTEVGVLNRQRSSMINKCKDLGVRYNGKIVVKQDKVYARFERHI